MHRLGTYLPQDRLRALIRGESLPDRVVGSAIFADISGFTRLTEKLTQTLGPRRGVEALSHQINAVYGALIDQVESYGGSVISFAGDSIIGWFEGPDPSNAALRAVTCAGNMQAAMQKFQELWLKVAITSGPARRLVAGDPNIQLLDTLAGRTIGRLAMAERLAQKGEVLLDTPTLDLVRECLTVLEQRVDPGTSERFSVLASLVSPAERQPLPEAEMDSVPQETLRPWLLAPVYQREQAGLISFLTELRPAIPFFVNFSGIDYDNDEQAEEKQLAPVASPM